MILDNTINKQVHLDPHSVCLRVVFVIDTFIWTNIKQDVIVIDVQCSLCNIFYPGWTGTEVTQWQPSCNCFPDLQPEMDLNLIHMKECVERFLK